MNIKPMNDMICVRVAEKETVTESGIFLPGSAADAPVKATVVAVGPGSVNSNGERKTIQLVEGDTILFVKDTGVPFKLEDDDEVLFLKEEHIVAVVK